MRVAWSDLKSGAKYELESLGVSEDDVLEIEQIIDRRDEFTVSNSLSISLVDGHDFVITYRSTSASGMWYFTSKDLDFALWTPEAIIKARKILGRCV